MKARARHRRLRARSRTAVQDWVLSFVVGSLNDSGVGHRTFDGPRPVRPLRHRHQSLDACRPTDALRTAPCAGLGRRHLLRVVGHLPAHAARLRPTLP
jgi:hypothetical protein